MPERGLPPVAATAAAAGLAATVLDGLDGWLARRAGMASAFGARFDVEVDALLIQALAILTWRYGKAGPWVLLASRSTTYVSKTPLERPIPPGQYRPPAPPLPFLPPDKFAGYYVVTYWLRELTVVGGGVEAVELTDRNVWLTGVAENIQPPRLPDQPYQPRR